MIYAFDEAAPPKRAIAQQIMLHGEGILRLPLQVVGEAFRVLTRRKLMTDADAQAVLTQLMNVFPTIPSDDRAVLSAMRLLVEHDVPYWDALLVATASFNQCSLLLSEDFQDGRLFGIREVGGPAVRIVNPFAERNRPILEAARVLRAH